MEDTDMERVLIDTILRKWPIQTIFKMIKAFFVACFIIGELKLSVLQVVWVEGDQPDAVSSQ